jgi:hypothetical protein
MVKKIKLLAFLFLATVITLNAQTFTPRASYLGQWAFYQGVVHKPTTSIYIPGTYQFGDIDQIAKYNVTTNTWSTVGGLPALKSEFGFAFGVANRIFLGGGVDQPGTFTNIVYELIPPNTFVAVDNIPNGPGSAFTFTIGNFGYVGSGFVAGFGNSNTFYRFNPVGLPGTQWSIMSAYPGLGKVNQHAVALNGYGYTGLGRSNPGGTEYNDWWRYDPAAGVGGTWTAMTAFPGAPRECSLISAMCDRIILMGGVDQSGGNFNDIWEFNPSAGATGTWTFLGNNALVFGPQSGRYGPASASYGDSLFYGMGFGASGVNNDWNMFTYCPVPLPITLIHFKADKLDGDIVALNWTTASEINNEYFEIQRSNDAMNWIPVAQINGAGNSSAEINYQYLDYAPFSEVNYYRLKQVDFNGTYEYSWIISIDIDKNKRPEIFAYPNPAYSYVNISQTNQLVPVPYVIYDSFGVNVQSGTLGVQENTLHTDGLSQGVYYLHLEDMENTTVKIIKM